MQALEFKRALVISHFQNGRDRMRIVRGKLRIDAICHLQQFLGATDIGYVSCCFSGKQGETAEPFDLCPFDFGVPIGAFDQTHHDFAIKFSGQRVQPVQNMCCTLSVGLNHDAKAIPACQRWIAQDGFDHVKRQVEPVSLFRVDIQAHACVFRLLCKFQCQRHQLGHDPIFLTNFIAGMQR